MSFAGPLVAMSWAGFLVTLLSLGAVGLFWATTALERWLDAPVSQPPADSAPPTEAPLPAR